ncbi:isoamyl acetate-hydrolyzing esterase [Coemansia sp. RSA 2711]|nr:isoamyl acetate-hydrolyzing esterase [Coemansia sp. RSA 2711]
MNSHLFLAVFSSILVLLHFDAAPMLSANSLTYDRIVCLGDSLTQRGAEVDRRGWTAQLAQAYARRLDLVNRGFGGFNSRWLRAILPAIMPARDVHSRVRLATVLLGANDAQFAGFKCHVPLDEFRDNLRAIAAALGVLAPGAHLLLVTPPPFGEKLYARFKSPDEIDRGHAGSAAYAQAVRQVAAELHVPCVDLWSAIDARIEPAVGQDDGYDHFLHDGLHLNANGNDLLFALLTDAIKSNFSELDPDAMPFVVPSFRDFDNTDHLLRMLGSPP